LLLSQQSLRSDSASLQGQAALQLRWPAVLCLALGGRRGRGVLPKRPACAPHRWALRARCSACICLGGGCMLTAKAVEAGHACLRAWHCRVRPNACCAAVSGGSRGHHSAVNTGLKDELVRQRMSHAWQTQNNGDALLFVAQHWCCVRRVRQLQATFAKCSNRRAVAGCACRTMARQWQAFHCTWGLMCGGLRGTRSQRPAACGTALCRLWWSSRSVQRRTRKRAACANGSPPHKRTWACSAAVVRCKRSATLSMCSACQLAGMQTLSF